jgi:hypothetical protein
LIISLLLGEFHTARHGSGLLRLSTGSIMRVLFAGPAMPDKNETIGIEPEFCGALDKMRQKHCVHRRSARQKPEIGFAVARHEGILIIRLIEFEYDIEDIDAPPF